MLATTALALALAANPELDDARALFQALHYTEAVPLLKRATEAAGQTQAERREVYDLLARAWAAEGDLVAAQAAYGELLAKDAYAPAPANAAPKIREAFRAAKAALYPPGTVRLSRRTATLIDVFDPWSAVDHLEVHEGKPRPVAAATMVEVKAGAAVEARGANGEVLASLPALEQHRAHVKPAAPLSTDEPRSDEPPALEELSPPALVPAPPPPAPVLVEPRTTWRKPVSIALAVIALAQAAVAIGVGVTAQNDANDLQRDPPLLTQRDAFALAARQRIEAGVANVFITSTAVFAVAGILVYLFGPTE